MTVAAPGEGAAGTVRRDPGSFRDPSGFVYRRGGHVYRQIEPSFTERWAAVEATGLLTRLAEAGKVLPYDEAPLELAATASAARVIRPAMVPFISYPYEWSFGQLRDAALLTLEIQQAALEAGLTLRDASAYNIQFLGSRPVHIDHLSLEPAGAHIHLHARAQRRYAGAGEAAAERVASTRKVNVGNLVISLRDTIGGLSWEPHGTEWAEYDANTSYGAAATASKERLVANLLAQTTGATVWDLGANAGRFSRIAAEGGRSVLSFDIDPAAVERNYRSLRADGREDILPLVMDVADPSPALGWAHRERASLTDRAPADVSLALALVHHLAIGRNIPLPAIAEQLARFAPQLIIEFVPRDDPMVRQLLATREDVFPDYTPDGFRAAFGTVFETVAEAPVEGSGRTLSLYRRR
jgi:hypothetical protein